MTDDNFRKRYHQETMVTQVTDLLVSVLMRGDMAAHDLARCATLAAQIYAERYGAPMTVVIRDGVPGEFLATEVQLQGLFERALTAHEVTPIPHDDGSAR